MSTPTVSPPSDNPPSPPASTLGLPAVKPVTGLHFKSILLMLITVALSVAALGYVLYARGVFEDKQTLVLTADDSEGVVIGMNLTFSGFPIGSVRQIQLNDDGTVRILIDVPMRHAHRLRDSSIFTMVRNILGVTSLKAYTSDWDDPPLADNAQRTVLYGDASADIPQLLASMRNLVNNLGNLTGSDSDLAKSLNSVSTLSSRLAGTSVDGGALKVLLGDGPELAQLQGTLTQANQLMASLNQLVKNADTQVFGKQGLMRDAQGATQNLATMLEETRQSLKQIDAILGDVKSISGHVNNSTEDLNELRTSVESNLRQIDELMGQLQNTWPFTKDRTIRLP